MTQKRVLVEAFRGAVALTVLGAIAVIVPPSLLPHAGGVAFARGGGGGEGGQGDASAGAPAAVPAQASGAPAAQDRAALSSALGALGASVAFPGSRANAAQDSRLGGIASYEDAMLVALTRPGGVARDEAIATARSRELAGTANRPVTSAVVRRVDALLGLPAADPTLGVAR